MYAHNENKQTPLVIVEIPVHGEVVEIPIYEYSNIEELTYQFIKRHSLSDKMSKPIQNMLMKLMNEALVVRQAKRNKQKMQLQESKMDMQFNQSNMQQDNNRQNTIEDDYNNNKNSKIKNNSRLSQQIQNNYESCQNYNNQQIKQDEYEQGQKNSKHILKSSKYTKEYLTESSDSDYEQVKLVNRSLRQSSKLTQSQNYLVGKSNYSVGMSQEGSNMERKQPKENEWRLIGDGYGCREEYKGQIFEGQNSQQDKNSSRYYQNNNNNMTNNDSSIGNNDNNSQKERYFNNQNNSQKRDQKQIIKINNRVSRFDKQGQEMLEESEVTKQIHSKSQNDRIIRDVSPNSIVDTGISKPSPKPTSRNQQKQMNNFQLNRQPTNDNDDDTEVDELIAPKEVSTNAHSQKVLQVKHNIDQSNAIISQRQQQQSQIQSQKNHSQQITKSSHNQENIVYSQQSNSLLTSHNQFKEYNYQSNSQILQENLSNYFPIEYSSSMSIQQNKSRSITPRRRIFEKQSIASPIGVNEKSKIVENNNEDRINYFDNNSGWNNTERSKITSFRQVTQLQQSEKQLQQHALKNRKGQY